MDPMIWIIDDDASIRFVFDKALTVNGMSHRLFESAEDALAALKGEIPDVVVSDIRMPGIDGLSLIRMVHETDPDIPFIIITAHSDLTAAIDSYERGSFEYLPKPFDIEHAIAVIRRAAVHRLNLSRPREERQGPESLADSPEIIGKSPAMQEVFKLIGRVSKTDVPVFILGETGTGRGLVALTLHRHGARASGPFVPLDLTSVPHDTVEVELFGKAGEGGALGRAQGGTLFINEVGALPLEAQSRLLQHLQRQGDGNNPRIITATSSDPKELTAQGFLPDLLYRLNIISIRTPPLRDRNNDIPMLAKHFLAEAALEQGCEPKRLTSEVLIFLCRQSWPGNVRQLKNLCKYLTIMVTGRDIQLIDLPQEFIDPRGTAARPSAPEEVTRGGPARSWQDELREWAMARLRAGEDDILSEATPEFERALIHAALDFTENRKQEAAHLLGWGRNTLTRKIKELGLS
ncbi:MAG: nitrogen regulation protein NR(I) [Succinivibrionaceae bacterium]|nr:nitrogen regulation protein NR(I) [Succinivibrionaceae bacterium]